MSAKSTATLLKKLRNLMCSTSYINPPVHAYVIPSGDAHQVCVFSYKIVNDIVATRAVYLAVMETIIYKFSLVMTTVVRLLDYLCRYVSDCSLTFYVSMVVN